PAPQQAALPWIAPLHQQHPGFQLQDGNGGNEQLSGQQTLGPGRQVRIGLAALGLAQFGHDIGIEQEHQLRSAGRDNSRARGASNSTSSTPGMASMSMTLPGPPVRR